MVLIAFSLLAIGEAAPGWFGVPVVISVQPGAIRVSVEGIEHDLPASTLASFRRIAFEQPGPLQREYQVDGSETTVAHDLWPDRLAQLLSSPLYSFDAFLRDEGSYSRWENVRLLDDHGMLLASGVDAVSRTALPESFQLHAWLRRPEAPATIWFFEPASRNRQGLRLQRDTRDAVWVRDTGGGQLALPRWFFPEAPLPFLAELLQLLGRSAAAAMAGLVLVIVLSPVLSPLVEKRLFKERLRSTRGLPALAAGLLAVWLMAAAWVSAVLYRQSPHVLDAVAYVFQAGVFLAGHVRLAAPPVVEAFAGPFQLTRGGEWFAQYPPGAPAAYALGSVVGLGWLVGPLAGAALIGLTAYAGLRMFGPRVAILTLFLGCLSPFILFQAGSFLSHPIAGAWLAGALAAWIWARQGAATRAALVGACLGAAFVTRETSAVLFALPLVGWWMLHRQVRPLVWLCVGAVPLLLVYLAYNWALTGNPIVLPRFEFAPNDRFGFGDGIGFHLRHTLAAGLANADEMLTLLQFDQFGWPPLALFAVLLAPFLLGQTERTDIFLAAGWLAFVVAFVGFYYHGIALGVRYYYESLPYLLLLCARGLVALAEAARKFGASSDAGRLAVGVVLLALCANNVLVYTPSNIARRRDFSAIPGGLPLRASFLTPSMWGPRLSVVPTPSLVFVPDWWWYNALLESANCPDMSRQNIDGCPVLFAFAARQVDEKRLAEAYPGRALLRVRRSLDSLELTPAGLSH